jgi:integrase
MGRRGDHPGVFQRTLPGGKTRWSYRYFYGGRWIRLSAPNNTQRSAQRALDDAKEIIDRGGDPTKRRNRSMTVAQVLDAYVGACRDSKKRAIRRYEDFKNSLTRHIGTRQVSVIDEDLLLGYRKLRSAEKVSDATVNRELAFLRAALNRAKQTGAITNHFFDALHTREARRRVFPQETPSRGFQRLPDEDLEAIVAAFPEGMRDVIRRASTLALLSGMRRSEVFGLEWSSLFPDRIRLIKTKNGKAREIPLTKAMRLLLPPRRIGGGLVFQRPDGFDLSKNFDHAWRDASRLAGLHQVRFHDLRHEWASRYVEAGGDLVSLMEVGGWSSLSLVQRYAMASQDRIRFTLERISNGTPDSTRAVSTADTIQP